MQAHGGGSPPEEWKNSIPNNLVLRPPRHADDDDNPLESFPLNDVVNHEANDTRPYSTNAALENMEIGKPYLAAI